MTDKLIKVGLVGFGTVGTGVAKILLEDADAIQARTGLRIELATVVDLDTTSPRPVKLPEGMLTDDLDRLLDDDSIQVAVELVGGTTFAKDLQLKMLGAGKHVVTANKALLAKFGTVLYDAAIAADRCIGFEASCAVVIPIVLSIRTGLAANRIEALYGILNGTCNYILTNMSQRNLDFATALAQAQEKAMPKRTRHWISMEPTAPTSWQFSVPWPLAAEYRLTTSTSKESKISASTTSATARK